MDILIGADSHRGMEYPVTGRPNGLIFHIGPVDADIQEGPYRAPFPRGRYQPAIRCIPDPIGLLDQV